MAKILFVSDSPTLTTGYGRVGKELSVALSNAGHNVTYLGWGFQNNETNPFPFTIIPVPNASQEMHGEEKVARFIRGEQPDVVITLGDPWMTQFMVGLEERRTVCWVNYFPIDGHPIPPNWHSVIKDVDVPVVFSKYAFELVKDIIGKKPVYIPHGVNTEIFKPLDNRDEIRNRILGIDSNTFVVGCVARNQPRKNLPALIKAFSHFAKNKEDAVLYLHTSVRDVGWNIDELVERFEITDKSFSTSGLNPVRGVPDEQLNEVYNLFDIFALPTMAEGFGLPILEAQSCGVPVLVTDFSACPDLVVDRQQLIKVSDTLIMGRGIEQAIVDTDDLTRKLNYFYNDWKTKKGIKLNNLGEKGRSLALTMDWNKVNEEFVRLINTIEPQAKKIDKTIRPNFYRI